MRYLIDTNVLSELTKPQPNQIVEHWFATHHQSVELPVVVIAEIRHGIQMLPAGRRKLGLTQWFNQLNQTFASRIRDLDYPVMMAWADLRAQQQRKGHNLPVIDSLIAATALHHHCPLVTRNVADFEGLGLELINPFAPPNSAT